MACLKKLNADITYDCGSLAIVGGTGEIDEAVIINSSDIASISADSGNHNAGTIVMQTGKKGFVINSVNNSIMYQDAIKVNDTVPPAEDQSVILKILRSIDDVTRYREIVQQLLGGNFRVALKSKANTYFLAGAFCGLEASDLATDSSTGGISTVTLKTPEASTGDMLLVIPKGMYDGLKIPKV